MYIKSNGNFKECTKKEKEGNNLKGNDNMWAIQFGLDQEQRMFQQECQGQQRFSQKQKTKKQPNRDWVANNISRSIKTFIKRRKMRSSQYKKYLKDKQENSQLIVFYIYLYLKRIRANDEMYDQTMEFLQSYINKRIIDRSKKNALKQEIQKWKVNLQLVNQIFSLYGQGSICNQRLRDLSRQLFAKKEQLFSEKWNLIISIQMQIYQSIHGQDLERYLQYDQFLSLQPKMEGQN